VSRPTQGSSRTLRIRGCHPLRPAVPDRSASFVKTTGLLRFRSPLLAESRLMSVPPGTEMFQFPGFASAHYGFMHGYRLRGGLPHSDIHGSTPARGSPWLFAACHVLLRLLVPRHPPNALLSLEILHHAQKPASVVSGQWSVVRSFGPNHRRPSPNAEGCAQRSRSAHNRCHPAHTHCLARTPMTLHLASERRPDCWMRTPHPVRHAIRHAQKRTRTSSP
jgi:hypothetical protein